MRRVVQCPARQVTEITHLAESVGHSGDTRDVIRKTSRPEDGERRLSLGAIGRRGESARSLRADRVKFVTCPSDYHWTLDTQHRAQRALDSLIKRQRRRRQMRVNLLCDAPDTYAPKTKQKSKRKQRASSRRREKIRRQSARSEHS